MITSASNQKIKNVTLLLTKSKERKKQGLFVTEGVKMFLEAPKDWIREIYLSEEVCLDGAASDKLFVMQEDGEAAVEYVKADVFRKMCDTKTPQGILCVLAMPAYDPAGWLPKRGALERMQGYRAPESGVCRDGDAGLYLILEDIQDPGNLGTILRTGEGAGITGVIMSANTVDIFNPKTVRATMGSIYRVPFAYADDLVSEINAMKEAGVRVYAAHLQGAHEYDREDYRRPTAFLIGNEGNGLSRKIADMADTFIKIPMKGKVESLNAAIAAALLIYETARQRRN